MPTKRLTLVQSRPDPTAMTRGGVITLKQTQVAMGRPIACLDDETLVELFKTWSSVSLREALTELPGDDVAKKVREHLCCTNRGQLVPFHDFIVREFEYLDLVLSRSTNTHPRSPSGPSSKRKRARSE